MKSLILESDPSVRLPSRIVPIWVSDPTGMEWPRRTSSTPAMKVVLTAPIPGVKIPSFPFGGATLTGLRILFPQSFVLQIFVSEHDLLPYHHTGFRQ